MAFTTRAERQTAILSGNTPQQVGPGSYGAYFDCEVDHAYAPFSSTSERSGMSKSHVTPGPGSYDITGRKYMGGPRYITSPTNVGFLTRSRKLQELPTELLLKPGPGAYNIRSDFANRKHSAPAAIGKSNSQRNIMWFRAPSAPSIPRQDQAFGYEEGPAGQLVKQKAPVETHGGDRRDMVGPGNYEPSIAATRPNVKGFDFGASKSEREPFKGKSLGFGADPIPGPGAYEVFENAGGGVTKRKPTSNFSSRVLRPHQIDRTNDETKRDVPGPGAYAIPDSFQKARRSLPENFQCFGSTSKRSVSMSGINTPGPGSYDDNFRTKNYSIARGPQPHRSAPFLSTGSRFTSNADNFKGEVPGPGWYDEHNRQSFVAQLAKKRFNRGGAFGSNSKRFSSLESDKAVPAPPGPGAYSPKEPKQLQGQIKKGPMSVFVSTSSRFVKPSEQESKPEPGQYYTEVNWSTGYKPPDHAARTAFITSSKRFDNPSEKKAIPGPGAYSQEAHTLGSKVQNVLKQRALFGDEHSGFLFGTEARFGGKNNKDVPGPGQYDPVDPYGQLIKRSFNITVEGSI